MNGFAKIFASMLRSTVWVGQPWHVKLTWITLLMLADAEGNVWASVPGLARDAEVTPEQCEQALAVFMAPDRHSRTKAHEGRRVIEIDGGWYIINHLKYRELQTRKQALAAKRARDHYARKTGKVGPAQAFEAVTPDVSSVRPNAPNAPNATDLAEADVYGTRAAKSPRRRSKQTAETIDASVRPDATNASLLLPLSDQSLDPVIPEPIPIPKRPAKARRARATPVSALPPPELTSKVPAWWAGPKPHHAKAAQERRRSLADEAARFRLVHFKPFPATEQDIDDRFSLFLIDAEQFALRGGSGPPPSEQRPRVPGAPEWIYVEHAAFAAEHAVHLVSEAEQFENTYHLDVEGQAPCDLFEPFMRHLKARAAAKRRTASR